MVFLSRRFFAGFAALLCAVCICGAALPVYTLLPEAESPAADNGRIDRYIVSSRNLGCDMTVDVWLPQTYAGVAAEPYPVLYAHDGQNIFDPALSFAGVAWELDRTAWSVASESGVRAPIIVGIHNRGAAGFRPNDYFPEQALRYISDSDRDKTAIYRTCAAGFYGDRHAAFVAEELKPLIDSLYNTDPTPSQTMAIGSSMGALASLYLLCRYPDVFGAAACLSTHWIGSFELNINGSMRDDPVCAAAILDYLAGHLPAPQGHRLYLDEGTEGWDASYLQYEASARRIVADKGYSTADGTLCTYDAAGADHNEWFWQQRVSIPLTFLLGRLSSGVDTPSVVSSETIVSDLSGRPVREGRLLAPGYYLTSWRRLILVPF